MSQMKLSYPTWKIKNIQPWQRHNNIHLARSKYYYFFVYFLLCSASPYTSLLIGFSQTKIFDVSWTLNAHCQLMSINKAEACQVDHKQPCCFILLHPALCCSHFLDASLFKSYHVIIISGRRQRPTKVLQRPNRTFRQVRRQLKKRSIITLEAALWEKEHVSVEVNSWLKAVSSWIMKGSKLQTLVWDYQCIQNKLNGRQTDPYVPLSSCCKHRQLCLLVSIIFYSFTTPVAFVIELQFECNDPLKCQTQKPKNKEGEYWCMRCFLYMPRK